MLLKLLTWNTLRNRYPLCKVETMAHRKKSSPIRELVVDKCWRCFERLEDFLFQWTISMAFISGISERFYPIMVKVRLLHEAMDGVVLHFVYLVEGGIDMLGCLVSPLNDYLSVVSSLLQWNSSPMTMIDGKMPTAWTKTNSVSFLGTAMNNSGPDSVLLVCLGKC